VTKARFAGSMAAILCVWGMLESAAPAKAEPAIQRSGAPALEGTWIPNPRFTFLKMGSCVRTYRCVAPDRLQAGARHFTASPAKKQAGLCTPGVDSVDYCGLCETDEPKEHCTYNPK
jgi:hypothetical protein